MNKSTEKPIRPKAEAKAFKQASSWPENLLRAMEENARKAAASKAEQKTSLEALGISTGLNEEYGEAATAISSDLGLPDYLSEDQMNGLKYVISLLKDNEKEVVCLRYEEQKMWREVAEAMALSTARCEQIAVKAIRKLCHPKRLAFIRDGLQGADQKRKETIRDVESLPREGQIERLKSVSVYECGLSVRAGNSLGRQGLSTLGDVVVFMDKDPIKLLQIRSLGRNSLEEVIKKLEEYGVDCNDARKACDLSVDFQREDVAYLNLSVRLMNILHKNGLEKISAVKTLIEKDPYAFLRMHGMGQKTLQELIGRMEELGVDCDPLKYAAGFKTDRPVVEFTETHTS